ncbi:MAG: hypothetical protein JWL96_1200 [Sphingomonas bacterium]|jgi:hypothetical protein|uniref:hypothetical protein n=1 Tax=Sphingomonas bacterium TaxID=1895847 RepID=UPI0026019893|nr:hypothetical protein [Sphingomonas bacterium]MDB5709130.1 hypothetical protein [Sphingomonas bacterium]
MSDPEEQRRILSLSFEPQGDGYLYYHWRWSRGVPVSAAEREAYLRIPALGSRRAWRRAIEGRLTAPPRAYGPVHQKLAAAFPAHMVVMGIIFGSVALISAWNAPSVPEKIGVALVGFIMLLLMVPIVVAKISARRGV